MRQTTGFDVLIIGSGAAGLSLALRLADRLEVAVLSKGPLEEGSTLYAQGGISAVLDAADTVDAHVADTLDAGAGLCREEAVRFVVERGRDAVEWLQQRGVPFTRATGTDGVSALHLTREGGHSHRRVAHAADATGRAIETTLQAQVRQAPGVTVLEHHMAVDIITAAKLGHDRNRALGAYVLDMRDGTVRTIAARHVVLAAGGAGKAYLYTSNPDGATGDGIAMGWRAGCRVANMEFMQFHPTCLYHPQARSFLITEALRGEGARLLLPDGTPFLQDFDARAELAPRDIVARAIDHEMKRLGASHVLLDATPLGADFIREHFPTVHARCMEFGFDMALDPLPVVPAAHYTCGGIVTDFAGRTDMAGLYAIGECAHTGLHGANRMASNSLLECLVFAAAAADDLLQSAAPAVPGPLPPWDDSRVTDSDEEVVVTHNWHELRRFMWDYVGIVRTNKRLQRAQNRLQLLMREIDEYYGNFHITGDLVELRNLVLVSDLIVRSAMLRTESRGLHYSLDYPERDESGPPRDTILQPDD